MPAIETQADADEKMVDLPSTGASVDVEIDDKETIINKEEPEAVETVVRTDDGASQDEVEDYGKKVQSRIDKLTKKAREAERREQAAVEYGTWRTSRIYTVASKSRKFRHWICK